jgi:cyclohexyl-isocyanide hydratase
MTTQIGFLLFPGIQQLDLTGPYDVLAALPDVQVRLIAQTLQPVASSTGLLLTPDLAMADCPPLDILCVPGGAGVELLMEDAPTLAFLRRQAPTLRYLTSVCTGALVLGAAGLLCGRRATTHWAYHDLLTPLGATAVQARVVRDGNLITGGGITAGIDFALVLAAELVGEHAAQVLQLALEYAPAPPFDSGSPATAPASVLQAARAKAAPAVRRRGEVVARVLAARDLA